MDIKKRKAKIEIYIIPFVIITLISIITVFGMSINIRNYYYDLKKEETLQISKSISNSLTHTGIALDNIDRLLDEKLIDFLRVTDDYKEFYSDDFLRQLANKYKLDEIYSYNSEGIIIYSSSGNYIGWKVPQGHPVYNFMINDEDILIEDIRMDTESDLYYKYGYIKSEDGTFLQIGILAERIQELLESVRLQAYIKDMATDSDVYQLSAIDKNYRISASTNENLIGSQLDNDNEIRQLTNRKMYDEVINIDGIDLYNIIVLLEHKRDNLIAFEIYYSLNSMQPVIKSNILITAVGVFIVYLSLIYSLVTNYRRNKRLIKLAYYDMLTGLPKVELLKEKISQKKIAKNNNKAIFMVKCDNLNLINLTLGYQNGDKVLKELGDRIKAIENNNIAVFKFTAEKFVLHINEYENREELLYIIEEINESITNKPFFINDIKEQIAIKIGIIEYKDTNASLNKLLKDSTIALNFVDTSEGDNYSFFDEAMELNIQRAEIIERELKHAINEEDKKKVYLVYQPIIDAKTNSITGFEALARMNSDKLGFVSPLEFIDIAERKQLIIPLSKFILKEASSFMSKLVGHGFPNIRVAVNISTIHLLQVDFVSSVSNIIEEAGISGANLELEITETIFMDNFNNVNNKLKKLREKGIHISLDDFGTGYSSFDRLSELNIDTLKIDQFFIRKIADTDRDSLITRDIISIAHRLGLKTVAEGVELDIQKDYLLEYDCDKLQGYLYSKPISENDVVEILKEYNG